MKTIKRVLEVIKLIHNYLKHIVEILEYLRIL